MNASQLVICSLTFCASLAQATTIGAEEPLRESKLSESSLTRAQVINDLNLWIQSGMSTVAYGEDIDPSNERIKQRMAVYNRLRHNSAFATEAPSKDLAALNPQTTSP